MEFKKLSGFNCKMGGELNCFDCSGYKEKCLRERRYTPWTDTETCFHRYIANCDLLKHQMGDEGGIILKKMLREYLKKHSDVSISL